MHAAAGVLVVTCVLSLELAAARAGRIFDMTSLLVDTVVGDGGQNLSLTCPGLAEQAFVLTLEWRCSGCLQDDGSVAAGEVLLVEYQEKVVSLHGNENRMSLDLESYALVFTPAVFEDSGEYSCLVNGRPFPERVVKLVVRDIPGPPGRPMVLAFDSKSVNLSWAPGETHHSSILHYLLYRKIGEYGQWDEEHPLVTATNDTKYLVNNLRPFTIYSFRVAGVNALGRSHPSLESFFIITLREAPTGKPTILAAHNTSANSIRLSWRAPPLDTINGEFLGYRITYKPRDAEGLPLREVIVRDAKAMSYTLKHLSTFTQYLISLQVINPEGSGPASTVVVMTDEGVPSKPRNVTVLHVTDRSVEFAWEEPADSNGILQGYRLYFMRSNFTDVRTIRGPSAPMRHRLSGLVPYSEYKLWLKAFTWKNEGEPSNPVVIRTDTSGPEPPNITNLTCVSPRALWVQWIGSPASYGPVDHFYVHYRRETSGDFEEIGSFRVLDGISFQAELSNLTADTTYEIKVQGGSRSVYDAGLVRRGQFSPTRKVFVRDACERALPKMDVTVSRFTELNAGIVAGIVCGTFALILAILAFILWRKCFYESYYYLSDGEKKPPPSPGDDWSTSADSAPSIPVYLFPAHVAKLHADGDVGFSKEYEMLQDSDACSGCGATINLSQHPENKGRNRYMNILAYDHSRVVLKPGPGRKKAPEYINANHVDGFHGPRAYIATQGPLPSTFEPFWRMVWQQKVHVIVMITNLEERGRKKCDLYWPKQGAEVYGVIQVKLTKETILATHTIRQFLIRHLKIKCKKSHLSERLVLQYHYTNWPDHGTPEHPLPILSFVRKSSEANPWIPDPSSSTAGSGAARYRARSIRDIFRVPSAGVGRTGAYIVIDAMLRQIKAHGKLNIFGFLKHIRSQRNFLVQTEEQYIFIHDVLLEAILSGETNIRAEDFHGYIRELQFPDVAQEANKSRLVLDSQYKLVTLFQPIKEDFTSALTAGNASKNRSSEFLPVEGSRVYITPKTGVEGSDYINASWLLGYHKLLEFIITQHPLVETISDFWQMVWDHNAQTIVLLSEVDDKSYPQFWPTKYADFEGDHYKVVFSEERLQSSYAIRDFTMQSLQDDYELNVRMIHKVPWLVSSNISSLFSLIRVVQDSYLHYQNGPIVIVDRYGGTEAATFACLMTLLKQLNEEKHVDVYMYSKLYHSSRPCVWKSQDDYLFLYRAVDNILQRCNGLCNSSEKPSQPTDVSVRLQTRIPPEGMESMIPCSESPV